VHCRRNVKEVLEELDDHVLGSVVVGEEFNCQLRHVLAEQCHPCRTVRLLQGASGGQRCAPIENPDVVEAEETTFENILPKPVLAIHPPGEVQQKLFESPLEESGIGFATQSLLSAMEKQSRPSVD